MHFFGGEPFAAFKEIVFAVNYARRKASELGIPSHFEVTTNGFYPEERASWIAENIDTVVLSLDGFPETQDRHRPGPNGAESFPTVCRSSAGQKRPRNFRKTGSADPKVHRSPSM